MPTLHRILVPVDFSDASHAALDFAVFLARHLDAQIDALHVCQPAHPGWAFAYPLDLGRDPLPAVARAEAAEQMKHLLAPADGSGVDVHGRLELGDPEQVILEAATDDGYDLVVMGTHGRTGMSHLLLGSLAEKLVRRSPCPVVTVRAPHPLRVVGRDDRRPEDLQGADR